MAHLRKLKIPNDFLVPCCNECLFVTHCAVIPPGHRDCIWWLEDSCGLFTFQIERGQLILCAEDSFWQSFDPIQAKV